MSRVMDGFKKRRFSYRIRRAGMGWQWELAGLNGLDVSIGYAPSRDEAERDAIQCAEGLSDLSTEVGG